MVDALEPRRLFAAGTLDTTFSGDGVVTTDVTAGDDRARDVVRQADGKIVVAGTANGDFLVIRYNTNGSLDTTFGTGGIVTTDFGGDDDKALSLTLQSDGKIVVVGEKAGTSLNTDIAVARYTTGGVLDTSFSGDGKLTTEIFPGNGFSERAEGVAIDSNNKIVVGGYVVGPNGWEVVVVRYNTGGALDTTFSSDGKVNSEGFVGNDEGRAVGVYTDEQNQILVAGRVDANASSFGVFRFTNTGALDNTFSGDGKQTVNFGTNDEWCWALAIQDDNKIVLGGSAAGDFALARLNFDGTLDTTFSGDGKQTTDFSGNLDDIRALAIQADGKIVAVGGAGSTVANFDGDFGIARYNANGTLDTTFSGDGKATYSAGTGIRELALGVALGQLADGQEVIYVAGFRGTAGDNTTNRVLVTRYLGDLVATPAAPSNAAVSSTSDSTVTLSWVDNAANESGFKFDQALNSSFTSGLTTVSLAANATSYTSLGLDPYNTYFFRVRSVNNSGESVNSNMVAASPNLPFNVAVSPDPDPLPFIGTWPNEPATFTFTRSSSDTSQAITIFYHFDPDTSNNEGVPDVDFYAGTPSPGSPNIYEATISAGQVGVTVSLDILSNEFRSLRKSVLGIVNGHRIASQEKKAAKADVQTKILIYQNNGAVTQLTNTSSTGLKQALANAINTNNFIAGVYITGHGDANSIDLANDGLLTTDTQGTAIFTETGEDITVLLRAALNQNAKIYLQACATANNPSTSGIDNGLTSLAALMSKALPGMTFTGYHGTAKFVRGTNTILGDGQNYRNGTKVP